MNLILVAIVAFSATPVLGQTAPFDPRNFVANQSHREPMPPLASDNWKIPALPGIDFTPRSDITLYQGQAARSLVVMQGDFAVISRRDPYEVLASNGAGPCVILALIDDANGVIGMSHIDSLTATQKTVQKILRRFLDLKAKPTRAVLAGGASEESTLRRVLRSLAQLRLNSIAFERSAALAVNLEGQLFNNGIYADNVLSLEKRRQFLNDSINGLSQPNGFLSQLIQTVSTVCRGNQDCGIERMGREALELYPQLEYPRD